MNHGDIQKQITNTWLGMVGPGVLNLGKLGQIFSDHTDIRPTILHLVGLTDDYTHDGRVLFEVMTPSAAGGSLDAHRDELSKLAEAYKEIEAPLGELGRRTLKGLSTQALESNDATYYQDEQEIKEITERRDRIAEPMIAMLEAAESDNRPIDPGKAGELIWEAHELIESLH
jgi:hypothetical protein